MSTARQYFTEALTERRAVSLRDVQTSSAAVTRKLGEAYNEVLSFKGLGDTMEEIPPSLLKQYSRTGEMLTLIAKAKALAYQSEMELRRLR